MARFLHRLGMFAARRKWVVLGVWVVAAVAVGVFVRTAGSNTSDDLRLPGTDSQAATDLLAQRFPPQQNGSSPIVFHVASGAVTDSKNKQAIEASHQAVAKLPHVASATDPFSQQGGSQISKDKRTAFIPVLLDVGGDELTEEIAQEVVDTAEPARQVGMDVAAGGPIGSELSEPKTESSEVVGLVAAMIILAFTFGTLVAMGLPIVSAVVGLLVGLSLIGLLGHVVTVPTIAPTLATMIGLGVGIDYALFLVSRHRAQRREGLAIDESIAMAVATSGSAIVFAGSTVVIALLALIVAGIPLVTSLGYAAAFAVVTAVLAAITLLPAVLAVVGKRLDSLRLPTFLRPKSKPPERGFWGWWSRQVTTHPWLAVAAAAAILAPLIVPFLSLELGQEDIGATPKSTTERQAYDLMAAGFGVGYNGPLLVATHLDSPAQASSDFESKKKQAQALKKQLGQEQTQGKSEQQQLTEEADELNQQQDELKQQQSALEQQQTKLESEQASLEQQANELTEEQVELQATRDRLQEKQASLTTQLTAVGAEAKKLAREGAKVAKAATTVTRRLARTRAEERATEARLRQGPRPPEQTRLEAELRSLERREDRLLQKLQRVIQQEQALRLQSQALVSQAEALRAQEADLISQAEALSSDATALAKEAVTVVQRKQTLVEQAAELQVQAANLQVQAADLQTQAANLQTQKVELQGQQQQAQSQQQQAEQLQTELTNELTKAGGDERGTDPRLVKLQNGLTDTLGVVVVSPPQINKAGNAAIFTVVATTTPAATETADLVVTLRTYTIPQATSGAKLEAFVGGQTASYVDLANGISSRLMLVILVVIALSFVVLLMAFRSLVVAVQAAVANVLSVAAAFGVLTAVFQWGWGLSLVGLDTASGTDPIASYVPLMMFAVLFGLSMDYQVFLISQIEHHRVADAGDREAVAGGLAAGARVIVAAALIMMSVFGSFILNDDPTVKQFGVGLSVGVALAAMTVLLLAPALLVLAGAGSWWLPAWLDRSLPHVDIEGASVRSASAGGGDGVEVPAAPAEP
jgi:uncharacterized membrane protein YdfJ with MMPL/SSD domain